MIQTINSEKTNHNSPLRASYGMSFLKFWENIPRENERALYLEIFYLYSCHPELTRGLYWGLLGFGKTIKAPCKPIVCVDPRWAWYQKVPCGSALKRYVKDSPGCRGHWATGVPSIQGVPRWCMPWKWRMEASFSSWLTYVTTIWKKK